MIWCSPLILPIYCMLPLLHTADLLRVCYLNWWRRTWRAKGCRSTRPKTHSFLCRSITTPLNCKWDNLSPSTKSLNRPSAIPENNTLPTTYLHLYPAWAHLRRHFKGHRPHWLQISLQSAQRGGLWRQSLLCGGDDCSGWPQQEGPRDQSIVSCLFRR